MAIHDSGILDRGIAELQVYAVPDEIFLRKLVFQ